MTFLPCSLCNEANGKSLMVPIRRSSTYITKTANLGAKVEYKLQASSTFRGREGHSQQTSAWERCPASQECEWWGSRKPGALRARYRTALGRWTSDVWPNSPCMRTTAFHLPGRTRAFSPSCDWVFVYLSRPAPTLTLAYTLILTLIHIYMCSYLTLKHLYPHTHTLTSIHPPTYRYTHANIHTDTVRLTHSYI